MSNIPDNEPSTFGNFYAGRSFNWLELPENLDLAYEALNDMLAQEGEFKILILSSRRRRLFSGQSRYHSTCEKGNSRHLRFHSVAEWHDSMAPQYDTFMKLDIFSQGIETCPESDMSQQALPHPPSIKSQPTTVAS